MKSSLLGLLFAVISFSAQAVEECPVQFGNSDYIEKVAELATNSSSCYEASEIVTACALGASGDVFTVGAAIARCEKDLPTMSAADKKTYDYLNEKCSDKYSSMSGSMYRSMNVFCHLSVSKLFTDLLVTYETP